MFRQPFRIEQGIGIWVGVDTSFDGFKEDKKLFVHNMHRILSHACYKWPTYVPKKHIVIFLQSIAISKY